METSLVWIMFVGRRSTSGPRMVGTKRGNNQESRNTEENRTEYIHMCCLLKDRELLAVQILIILMNLIMTENKTVKIIHKSMIYDHVLMNEEVIRH